MKSFQQIIIQSKDDKEDFRSFCYCKDAEGVEWTLRGYGDTAAKAAEDAWARYLSNVWDAYGYPTGK